LGDNDFRLLWDGALHRWSPDGYHDPIRAEEFPRVAVVTPAPSVMAMQHGYPVEVHPSAGRPARGNCVFTQPSW